MRVGGLGAVALRPWAERGVPAAVLRVTQWAAQPLHGPRGERRAAREPGEVPKAVHVRHPRCYPGMHGTPEVGRTSVVEVGGATDGMRKAPAEAQLESELLRQPRPVVGAVDPSRARHLRHALPRPGTVA